MDFLKLALAFAIILVVKVDSHGKCKFPAIYNFGDSNSDTGGRSVALEVVPPPHGETFFHKPSGRFCDGRLMIDFIAEDFGLPYLSPYLDSIETNFRHGANFATGGSSILKGGYSPFHLQIQTSQFILFKSRTQQLYKHHSLKGNLPRPQDFSKALYTFDIGQNDLFYAFQHNASEQQVLASFPNMLNNITISLQAVYNEGGRNFWIHNTGPVGCLPYTVSYHDPKISELDQIGCVETQNRVAREFNRQLQERVKSLSIELPQAHFTYVDMYAAKYELFSHAKKQGLTDPFAFCCGSYNGGEPIVCGKTAVVNGTVYGNSCHDPSRYVSWDGIHYSEASNKQIANLVISGSLSTPPVAIGDACHNQHY